MDDPVDTQPANTPTESGSGSEAQTPVAISPVPAPHAPLVTKETICMFHVKYWPYFSVGNWNIRPVPKLLISKLLKGKVKVSLRIKEECVFFPYFPHTIWLINPVDLFVKSHLFYSCLQEPHLSQ